MFLLSSKKKIIQVNAFFNIYIYIYIYFHVENIKYCAFYFPFFISSIYNSLVLPKHILS